MAETKEPESAYSRERTEVATVGNPQEETKEAESAETEKTAESSTPAQKTAISESAKETATTAAKQKTPSTPSSVNTSPVMGKTGEYSLLADFLKFLKRTRSVWLSVAGALLGLMVVVTGVNRLSEWARAARERRHEEAIVSVSPERLIARCGQPAEDVTKEVYPVLMRTMNYPHGENEKLVFVFSRTAEEKSDWVFLSMKDASGSKSYDTTEAKIAALPCLDSKK
jgi:hypothetical protein